MATGGQAHRRWVPVAILLVLTALMVAGIVKANIWKQGLRVSQVEARGGRIVPDADILALAGVQKDQKLFDIDLAAVRRRVEQNPFIKSAAVNREVPDRIVITVAEREPIVAMAGERLTYLDAEGVVLPSVRSNQVLDLPILTGDYPGQDAGSGSRIASEPVIDALTLLATARAVSDELYRGISEVHIGPGRDPVVYMGEGGVPVLFGPGNAYGQCVKLETFWKQFAVPRGTAELEYIDLRFDDQVVVRWRHAPELAQQ